MKKLTREEAIKKAQLQAWSVGVGVDAGFTSPDQIKISEYYILELMGEIEPMKLHDIAKLEEAGEGNRLVEDEDLEEEK